MAVLKEGSSGPGVKKLQARLKELGFDPKAVDGKFGRTTKEAVIAFLEEQGIARRWYRRAQTLAAL
jgi:peptidoglycan hydrolase-like protein with peptidoglycan-binding domain